MWIGMYNNPKCKQKCRYVLIKNYRRLDKKHWILCCVMFYVGCEKKWFKDLRESNYARRREKKYVELGDLWLFVERFFFFERQISEVCGNF
jgi:hypothetical protein